MLVSIDTLDEARLIEHVQSGVREDQEAAFSELMQRHNLRLLRYVARKGLALQEREDVAAEAWMRAWRKIDRYQYREVAGFFPWLRAIANNVRREYIRKHFLSRGSDGSDPAAIDFFPDDDNTADAIIDVTAARTVRHFACRNSHPPELPTR